MFGPENPLGHRVLKGPHGEWFMVIGVAADVRNRGLTKGADPEYYVVRKSVPDVTWANQEPPLGWREANLAVRTALPAAVAEAELRGMFTTLDPSLPVEIRSMRERLSGITERPRFQATLLGAFAAIGILLAAIGLFGVMSFLVAQRRREIGVRMALGARRSSIVGMVVRQGLILACAGTAVGIAGAAALTNFLSTFLYGTSPTDLITFTGVSLLFLLVAAVACFIPARQVTAIDPLIALRQE
jgi:predicted lysophospholipase L1 biosynthesis ABC-type transport system permease subunit